MQTVSEGHVRVMQRIALGQDVHCLRLCLEDADFEPVAPGQYCRLSGPGLVPQACSYVSLPDHDGCFMVAVDGARSAVSVGERLDYRGPLGCGWPLPLHASHLLLLVTDNGLLNLAALVDELGCWMPWVTLRLLCEPQCFERLPQECRGWLRSLGLAPAANPDWHCGDLLDRLEGQLRAQPPDLVFCSGSQRFSLACAELCLRHGVAERNIWLRADVLPPIDGPPAEEGPVFRLDRYPPAGRGRT
ncbi:hypothetical protein ACA097_00035 [Pseudomonas sp. QL9]|uniref:hypothetical protein n=1 Tax=Pseudomonas sp. QL9 TaxID=3242725 RepID=UPI00352B76A3